MRLDLVHVRLLPFRHLQQTKNIGRQYSRAAESTDRANEPACLGDTFQTRRSQNVVFESMVIWEVTVQTS